MNNLSNNTITALAMLLVALMGIVAMTCTAVHAQEVKVPSRFQPLEEEPLSRQSYYYNKAERKAFRQDWENKDEIAAKADSLRKVISVAHQESIRRMNTTTIFYSGGYTTIYTPPMSNLVIVKDYNY